MGILFERWVADRARSKSLDVLFRFTHKTSSACDPDSTLLLAEVSVLRALTQTKQFVCFSHPFKKPLSGFNLNGWLTGLEPATTRTTTESSTS